MNREKNKKIKKLFNPDKSPHSEPKAHHHPFYYTLITTIFLVTLIFSNPSVHTHEQNVDRKVKLTKKSAPQTFGIIAKSRKSIMTQLGIN
jgi:hypothetical protein